MKKKILFGLCSIAIAVVLTFNVSLAKNENDRLFSLNSISYQYYILMRLSWHPFC